MDIDYRSRGFRSRSRAAFWLIQQWKSGRTVISDQYYLVIYSAISIGKLDMSSTAITTVIKMIESVPQTVQDQIVEHLRVYIEDLQDEEQWNISFRKTQKQLIAAAQRAKQGIANCRAKPMDYDRL